MRFKYGWVLFIPLLIVASILAAQEKPSESRFNSNRRYVVLSTHRYSTLHKELKQAVAAGYRVTMGDAAYKILLLEKQPEGLPQGEFKVVENLKRDLNSLAREGFRLIPATVDNRGFRLAGVVERTPNSQARFEYRVFSPQRTSSLQKDVLEAAAQGYRPVAFSATGIHTVVVERPVGVPAQAKPEAATGDGQYLLLATSRSSTLQKELNAAVKKGYRVLLAAGGREYFLLLEKRPPNTPAPEYLLLAASRSGTIEREIKESAARGFRVLPRTLAALNRPSPFPGMAGSEITVVTEKTDAPELPAYLVIGTSRVDTFRKELADAEQNDFEPVRMILTDKEQVALLAKTSSK